MVKPITPSQVDKDRIVHIHPVMIKTINNLISERWNGTFAEIPQEDIIEEFLKSMHEGWGGRERIFEEKYLNIEVIYRSAGWRVSLENSIINKVFTFTK